VPRARGGPPHVGKEGGGRERIAAPGEPAIPPGMGRGAPSGGGGARLSSSVRARLLHARPRGARRGAASRAGRRLSRTSTITRRTITSGIRAS
jgi:hypothetical protein